MKSKTWAACLAGVALGFALSSLSQPQLIGQDRSKDQGRVKWEYAFRDPGSGKKFEEYGDEGWELITFDRGIAVFKRAKF